MNTIKPIEAVEHSWSDTGIYEVNGRRIAMLTISDEATEDNQEELEAQMSADARRLVACWNRLEQFTTEQIEDLGYDLTGTAVLAEEMRSFSVLHQKLKCRFNQIEEERDHLQQQLEAERASLFAESQRKQQLEEQCAQLLGLLLKFDSIMDGCGNWPDTSTSQVNLGDLAAEVRATIAAVKGGAA